jgi:DHA2 family multidrug resistance protein
MATAGMFLFFVFTTMLSNSTLAMGTSNFFIPLVIRGVGMALLFVPLTTLAIADLKGPEVGQGTGLNNMMRQLGRLIWYCTLNYHYPRSPGDFTVITF